jgi:acyl transferase domain-containing protein
VAGVELAVVNGPDQQVLAGPPAAIERLGTILTDRSITGKRLPVGYAFHTRAMEAMLPDYRSLLQDVAFKPVTVPFISGLDGRLRPAGWTPDPDYFLRHIRQPVRFDKILRTLGDGDVAALLEIGPGATFGTLARPALPGTPILTTSRSGAGLDPMWAAAAALHCAGADIDWSVLLEGCGGGRIALPGYRFQHKYHWTGPESSIEVPGTTPLTETAMKQSSTSVDGILRQITELTARHLRYEAQEITADGPFFDLGADSLQMINILRELEQEHQVKVTMRELFEEANTPRLLAELIAGRRNVPYDADLAAPAPATAPTVPTAPRNVPYDADLAAPATAPTATPPAAPPGVQQVTAQPEDYATRRELEELARQVRQLSQVQLQLTSQLAQLLDRTNGR